MKTLVNFLNCRPAALTLGLFVCSLIMAASSAAFCQVSFEKLWEVNHPADYPIDPGFSKDGKFIYAGGGGGIMQMDASNGQFIKYLDKGEFMLGNTESMTILPNGEYAFTKNRNTGYIIWDLNIGKAIKLFPYGKNRFDKALGVTISPDLKYLVFTITDTLKPTQPIASEDCTFYIFDIEKEKVKDSMRLWGHQDLFAFSSEGKRLVSVGYKNESTKQEESDLTHKVFVWSTENWTNYIMDYLTNNEGQWLSGGFQLLFSKDNKYFSWFPRNRKDVRVYSLIINKLIAKSDTTKDCQRIVFLPDSESYGFSYPELEIFDLKTNEPKGKLDFPIYQWAVYPQEKLLLAYGISNEVLYRMKSSSVIENPTEVRFTATYKDGKILIEFTPNIAEPYSLSVFNLTGKELYKSGMLFNNDTPNRIPIHLSSGFYILKAKISSKEYSTKIEVTR